MSLGPKRVTAKGLLEQSLQKQQREQEQSQNEQPGTMAATFPPATLRPIVNEVASLLKEKKLSVCIAETAAGGLISSSLLSVSGASSFYKGGLTLYTLPSRIAFADWTQANISSYAGPTPAVVSGLARSTRAKLGADFALAESGTAGPRASGEGQNRQPGYVALAVAFGESEGDVKTREVQTGLAEREGNMLEFAREGLTLLRDVLLERSGGGSGKM